MYRETYLGLTFGSRPGINANLSCEKHDVMLAGLDAIFKQCGMPGIEDLSTDQLSAIVHGIPAREGRRDAPAIPQVTKRKRVTTV